MILVVMLLYVPYDEICNVPCCCVDKITPRQAASLTNVRIHQLRHDSLTHMEFHISASS